MCWRCARFGLASGHVRTDERELIEHLQDVAAVEFEDSDNDEEGESSYNCMACTPYSSELIYW